MTNVQILKEKIQELRKNMYDLIDKKKDFLDPEVIETSKKLDDLLNELNKYKENEEYKKA